MIDDDRSIRWVLEKALEQEGIRPDVFESGTAALTRLRIQPGATQPMAQIGRRLRPIQRGQIHNVGRIAAAAVDRFAEHLLQLGLPQQQHAQTAAACLGS